MTQKQIPLSSFLKDPLGTLENAGEMPVVVVNERRPVFVCFAPESYNEILNKLEDIELAKIVTSRLDQDEVTITLDKL